MFIFASLSPLATLFGVIGMALILAFIPKRATQKKIGKYAQKIKQRHKKQQQREKIIPQLINSLSDPIMILSQNGQLKYANQRVGHLFNMARQGVHISKIIRSPEFLEAVENALQMKVKGSANYTQRIPVERQFAVNFSWIGQKYINPNEVALVVHFRDLSEGGAP